MDNSTQNVTTIYRIETKEGDGLYGRGRPYSESLWKRATDHEGCWVTHPTWDDDGFTREPKVNEKFGFETIIQMKEWVFGFGWFEALEREGGVLVILTVPTKAVRFGHKQVMYDNCEVLTSSTHSLMEIQKCLQLSGTP